MRRNFTVGIRHLSARAPNGITGDSSPTEWLETGNVGQMSPVGMPLAPRSSVCPQPNLQACVDRIRLGHVLLFAFENEVTHDGHVLHVQGRGICFKRWGEVA